MSPFSDVARLRLALRAANVGLWDWDLRTNRVRYSAEWKSQIGYEADEIGDDFDEWRSRVHPDDLDQALRNVQAYLDHPTPAFQQEFRFRHKDGTYRWILAQASIERGDNGVPVRMLGSHVDITERKRAVEALYESERQLNEAQHLAHLGSWFYAVGQGRTWSDEMFELLQLPRDTPLTDEVIRSRIHPEDLAGYLKIGAAAAASGTQDYESHVRVVWPDAQVRTLHLRARFYRDADGQVIGVSGTAQDITERVRADQALREANEQLRALSSRLLEIQEAERRTLAHELHDEIGQALSAVKLNAMAILQSPDPASLTRRIGDHIAIVDRALQQVRSLSLELRPALLDDLGLVPALRWLVDRLGRSSGVSVRLEATGAEVRFAPAVELAGFRIAQEAINNALKHAAPTRITVDLRVEGDRLDLRVRDDGTGFDVARAQRLAAGGGSLGLLGMSERARLAGGRIEWFPLARGTEVHAWFPIGAASRTATKAMG